jgi:hypothetical protein
MSFTSQATAQSKTGRGTSHSEKEDGKADLVPADDLRRFLAGSGVQCVFVSGCQSGKAPREALAGVCQALEMRILLELVSSGCGDV